MFVLISGFKLKSFLIMWGIQEGLIIRIVEQSLQDLWHLLLKQNPRLSFHHPSLIRWVKLNFFGVAFHTPPCLSFSSPHPAMCRMLEDHPEGTSHYCHSVFILHIRRWSAEFVGHKGWARRLSILRQVREMPVQKSSIRKRWFGDIFRKVRDTIAKSAVSVTVKLGRRTNKAEMKSLSCERHGVSRRE